MVRTVLFSEFNNWCQQHIINDKGYPSNKDERNQPDLINDGSNTQTQKNHKKIQ